MFSIRMKQLRKSLNLTQKELAGKLNCNWRTVQTWENERRKAPRVTGALLDAFSSKLDVNIDWLLHGTGEMFLPDNSPKGTYPACRAGVGADRGMVFQGKTPDNEFFQTEERINLSLLTLCIEKTVGEEAGWKDLSQNAYLVASKYERSLRAITGRASAACTASGQLLARIIEVMCKSFIKNRRFSRMKVKAEDQAQIIVSCYEEFVSCMHSNGIAIIYKSPGRSKPGTEVGGEVPALSVKLRPGKPENS